MSYPITFSFSKAFITLSEKKTSEPCGYNKSNPLYFASSVIFEENIFLRHHKTLVDFEIFSHIR